MSYPHEPRQYKGRFLFCINDGQVWPCEREQLRRSNPKHIPPNHMGDVVDCPACLKARVLLFENRQEAIATGEMDEGNGDQVR
jgi:hypothetical protein